MISRLAALGADQPAERGKPLVRLADHPAPTGFFRHWTESLRNGADLQSRFLLPGVYFRRLCQMRHTAARFFDIHRSIRATAQSRVAKRTFAARTASRLLHRGAARHADRRIAGCRERRKNLFGVRGIARLHGDVELRALGGNVEEQPMMIDRTECWRRKRRTWSRSGRECRADRGSSGRNETMRSSRSSSRTMIEARMRGSILPPQRMRPTLRLRNRRRIRQHSGKAGGAGTFRHRLLQGEKRVHRALDLRLVDQNDVADQFAHHRQGELADILHRDAFGEGGAAARPAGLVDGVPHRG